MTAKRCTRPPRAMRHPLLMLVLPVCHAGKSSGSASPPPPALSCGNMVGLFADIQSLFGLPSPDCDALTSTQWDATGKPQLTADNAATCSEKMIGLGRTVEAQGVTWDPGISLFKE